MASRSFNKNDFKDGERHTFAVGKKKRTISEQDYNERQSKKFKKDQYTFVVKSPYKTYHYFFDVLSNKPLPEYIINKVDASARDLKLEHEFVIYKNKNSKLFGLGYLYSSIMMSLVLPSSVLQQYEIERVLPIRLPYEIDSGLYILEYRIHDNNRKENILDFGVRAFTENVCLINVDFLSVLEKYLHDL